jgi:hypothetical protein
VPDIFRRKNKSCRIFGNENQEVNAKSATRQIVPQT